MVGWHLIFSTYGFWLPNDPRGSGSSRVRAQHIYDAGGEATKVHTRTASRTACTMFGCGDWRKTRSSIQQCELSGIQARAVARGIGAIVPKIELVIHACSIMPDHVHVVIAAHRFDGDDDLIACLKRAGTRGLNSEQLNPMRAYQKADGRLPSPWGGRGWKVMLFTAEQMKSAIRYVEQNPVRAGLKGQSWSFVVPFVG